VVGFFFQNVRTSIRVVPSGQKMENVIIRRITKLITGWQKIAKHLVIAVVSIKYFFITPGKSV
jgi:hypothetical protein